MEVFDYKNVRSLASVILWQYDKAINLQKLIWRTVRESDADGNVVDVQKGLLQRMMDTSETAFNEFYDFIFNAIGKAEEFPNTMETASDIESMNDVGKLFFGLTVWSRLIGVSRPLWQKNQSTQELVPLLSWARYMRAEIMKTFMRGTCFDINRYMRALLPHYNVYVIDGGAGCAGPSGDYMTQYFKYRPEFVYDGSVFYGSGTENSFEVLFSIDTSVKPNGEVNNRFVQIINDIETSAVICKYSGNEINLIETAQGSGIYSGSGITWQANADGVYQLTYNSVVYSPDYYQDNNGIRYESSSNILEGSPNIGTMMEKQYVDEYRLILANKCTANHNLFPHPAGVLDKGSEQNATLSFGDISDYIGLNNSQTSGQNAAVLNHGIIFENKGE